MATKDKTPGQLSEYKESKKTTDQITTSAGQPVGDKNASQTVGPRGPLLMQDFVFLDEMAHLPRERVPERVVHAKGFGAHGYFEVTHDITKYCKAKIFDKIGKKTPMFARMSTVLLERASPETLREPRGFAMKFYTEEGNWDLLCINVPILFIRDPLLFSSMVHAVKRNPRTNLLDANMFWDFMSLRPETTHHVSLHFADRGIPDGWRHMNAYGGHAFKLVNDKGEAVYCKFHVKTDQGIKNLMSDEAKRIAGEDIDYASRDLYNAIENGNYPSWTTYIQVMTFEEAEKFRWNPFDLTKVWPQGEFPLIPFGRIVLNRIPYNYFAEVEQSAFSPSHLIPGIEPSPDKMLHARMFSYPDAHRYRVGVNYLQLPINQPINAKVKNYLRDGPQCFGDNQGGAPNYYPNSFGGPIDNPKYLEHSYFVSGDVHRHTSDPVDDDEFSQCRTFWTKVLNPAGRTNLVQNIVDHMKDAEEFIQKRAIRNFTNVHPEYGRRVQELLDQHKKKQNANL